MTRAVPGDATADATSGATVDVSRRRGGGVGGGGLGGDTAGAPMATSPIRASPIPSGGRASEECVPAKPFTQAASPSSTSSGCSPVAPKLTRRRVGTGDASAKGSGFVKGGASTLSDAESTTLRATPTLSSPRSPALPSPALSPYAWRRRAARAAFGSARRFPPLRVSVKRSKKPPTLCERTAAAGGAISDERPRSSTWLSKLASAPPRCRSARPGLPADAYFMTNRICALLRFFLRFSRGRFVARTVGDPWLCGERFVSTARPGTSWLLTAQHGATRCGLVTQRSGAQSGSRSAGALSSQRLCAASRAAQLWYDGWVSARPLHPFSAPPIRSLPGLHTPML